MGGHSEDEFLLYVSQMPLDIDDRKLLELVASARPTRAAVRIAANGVSKGSGTVAFTSAADRDAAVELLQGRGYNAKRKEPHLQARVTGLLANTTEEDLLAIFKDFSPESANIASSQPGAKIVSGFVRFATRQKRDEAVAKMSAGCTYKGATIKVEPDTSGDFVKRIVETPETTMHLINVSLNVSDAQFDDAMKQPGFNALQTRLMRNVITGDCTGHANVTFQSKALRDAAIGLINNHRCPLLGPRVQAKVYNHPVPAVELPQKQQAGTSIEQLLVLENVPPTFEISDLQLQAFGDVQPTEVRMLARRECEDEDSPRTALALFQTRQLRDAALTELADVVLAGRALQLRAAQVPDSAAFDAAPALVKLASSTRSRDTMFVGGLPHEADDEWAREVLAALGAPAIAFALARTRDGRCKGHMYARFAAESNMRAVLARFPEGLLVRGRTLNFQAAYAPSPSSPARAGPPKLMTPAQRAKNRREQALPILQAHKEFCDKLVRHKVVVCVAETGSGKTTQLPQYCAELFEGRGLVVCTQPRATAAQWIARRVALEFDGQKPGFSVGIRGRGRETCGTRIVYCTDAELLRMAQEHPFLDDVAVVVVDEAHERSLYTDVALGICKNVRLRRPDSFHVVVASATIEPRPFVEFFRPAAADALQPDSLIMRVPGSMFEVSVKNAPPDAADAVDSSGNMGAFVRNHVVPTVLRVMRERPSGHALVFLPGQSEIEAAIREFDRSVQSASKASATAAASGDNIGNLVLDTKAKIEALALYGSMPPEQQQLVLDYDASHASTGARVAIFCTNVAETSVTVPGVRIIVDSGYAKEPMFDCARRMTVLELTRISRSSAKQRTGRAGRTAPGHCVRLYADDELVRETATPEIARSSLDNVALQLRILGYDPLRFPLIDKPDAGALRASIETLREIGCLDAVGAVTDSGRTVAGLDFEPRLAAFVLAAQDHGCLDEALAIASVLSAPGSIFALGSRADRSTTQARISLLASRYDSDLLFLAATFVEWQQAGTSRRRGHCACCGRQSKVASGACSYCRKRHAAERCLNNKILEIADTTAFATRKRLSLPAPRRELVISNKVAPAITRCLVVSYFEQIVEALAPADLSAGVRLLSGAAIASAAEDDAVTLIDNTSCTLQHRNVAGDTYFVTLSANQGQSGKLSVSKLHPVPLSAFTGISARARSWLAKRGAPREIKPRFKDMPRGSSFLDVARTALVSLGQRCRHAVALYDNEQHSVAVYCLEAEAKFAVSAVRTAVNGHRRAHEDDVHVIRAANHTLAVTLRLGCQIVDVALRNWIVEWKPHDESALASRDAVLSWVHDTLHVPRNVVTSVVPDAARKLVTVCFASSQALVKGRTLFETWREQKCAADMNIPAGEANPAAPADSSEAAPDHWGREVTVSLGLLNLTDADLVSFAGMDADIKDAVLNEVSRITPSAAAVSTKTHLKFRVSLLKGAESMMSVASQLRKVPGAQVKLQGSNRMTIQLDGEGRAVVYIKHADVFGKDALDALIDTCETRFGCRASDSILRYEFFSELTAEGANSPLSRKAGPKMRVKVCQHGLGLHIELYGDGASQGELLRWIGDSLESFSKRMAVVRISPADCVTFQPGKAGARLLESARHQFSCNVQCWASRSCLVFVSHKSADEMSRCRDAVLVDMQESLGMGPVNGAHCAFCKGEPDFSLELCGHWACLSCLESCRASAQPDNCCPACKTPIAIADLRRLSPEAASRVTTGPAVQEQLRIRGLCTCPTACGGVVALADGYATCSSCFRGVCARCGAIDAEAHRGRTCPEYGEWMRDMVACPSGCNGLVSRKARYAKCSTCARDVCGECGTVGHVWHTGRSCEQFEEYKRDMAPCPAPGCTAYVSRHAGLQKCSACHHWVCGSCTCCDDKMHTARSCAQYRELKQTGQTCSVVADLIKKNMHACPTANCIGVINAVHSGPCAACRLFICTYCDCIDDRHASRTCAEYKAHKLLAESLESLFKRAEEWARTQWVQMQPIDAVHCNTALALPCQSMKRFLGAIGGTANFGTEAGADDQLADYDIFFHPMLVQKKVATGYTRVIQRAKVPSACHVWEYTDDGGKWMQYDSVIQFSLQHPGNARDIHDRL
eukprot:m51a1_g6211 putative isoform a (2108) ;mRNA; r:161857-169489